MNGVVLMDTDSMRMIPGDIEDIRNAAMKMSGRERRTFLAEMTLKYCEGNVRKAETVFGWGRKTIETGLGEKRTGLICIGSQSFYSGRKRWEEHHPDATGKLLEIAESHAQQDPDFRTAIAYTRLTAPEALRQLSNQGLEAHELPSRSTMAEILNRSGYRLRKVIKARPQKKSKKPTPFSPISKKKMNRPKPGGSNASA